MKGRIPLARAAEWADGFVDRITPTCDRVVVAGSIRRRKPAVGDVEVVAMPRIVQLPTPGDLLTGPGTEDRDLLLAALNDIIAGGDLRPVKCGGQRFRQYQIPSLDGASLDLFMVRPPAQWGVILAIRTGPADYSEWLVTEARRRGLRVSGGQLLGKGDEPLPVPDEEAFYSALGLRYVSPELRVVPLGGVR